MFMTYDGNSVHIFGQAWGGLDTGSTYGGTGDNAPRLWDIDFLYDVGVMGLGDGVGVQAFMQNHGTIASDLGTCGIITMPAKTGFHSSWILIIVITKVCRAGAG